MATEQTPLQKIRRALQVGLPKLNGAARFRFQVSVQKSHVPGNIHVFVTSNYFDGKDLFKRARLVWDVLYAALENNVVCKISLIRPMTQKEEAEMLV